MKRPYMVAVAAIAASTVIAGCATTTSTTTTKQAATTHHHAAKPATTPTTSKPPAAKPTTTTTPPTTAKPQPQTLLDKSGNGIQTLPPVDINGPWTLKYSFDCTADGGTGNFIVNVNQADGSPNFYDNGPDALAASGSSSDYEPVGGNLSLDINSECNWNVQIVGYPGSPTP